MEALAVKIPGNDKLLSEATKGRIDFDPTLPVSPNSSFGDEIWDWNTPGKVRLNSLSLTKLRIDWRQFDPRCPECHDRTLQHSQSFLPVLTPEVIHDLKRAAFIHILSPASLTGRRGPNKPNTIVDRLKHLIRFIGHIRRAQPTITKLSQISVADIESGLADYPYRSDFLPPALKFLCHSYVVSNLKYGELKFNRIDVRQIKWPPTKEASSHNTLPQKLFKLLSDASCNLVGQFLCAYGIEPEDGTIRSNLVATEFPRFVDMFDSYVERREIIRDRGSQYVSSHTQRFKADFGCLPEEFSSFLFNAQAAAQVVILLYTGMRYSEVAGLQTGCLISRHGFNVVRSTVTKHKSNDLPINYDEWIATDVVVDSIRTLELISKSTFNKFLFGGFDTVKTRKQNKPLSNGGLRSRLRKYLSMIDEGGEWEDWNLHPHSFRHTLVHLLARAEVGIPYITMQLKHAHHRLSYLPDSVTIGYGNLKPHVLAKATGLKTARTEMLQNVYGANAKVAGAGAPKHVKRTEDFFQGIGLSGNERDEYLARLAESGVPLVPTGFGLCGCNHADLEALDDNPPPCYGDYQCRPDICEHAVVTEDSAPSIQARYEHACKQVDAPDQSYARKHWISVRDSLAKLLDSLQTD